MYGVIEVEQCVGVIVIIGIERQGRNCKFARECNLDIQYM